MSKINSCRIEYLYGYKPVNVNVLNNFLELHKDEFNPSLDTQINIPLYSRKIFDNAYFVLAKDKNNDLIIGLCAFYNNQNIAYLTSIIVDKNYYGLGIGEKLMSHMFYTVGNKAVRLEVYKTNVKAIALYKKFGFKLININNDFLVMERPINVPK